MKIIDKRKANGCKHEVGRVYTDIDQKSSVYLVGKYWEYNDPRYFYINLDSGSVLEYNSLEDLDQENDSDVEVNAKVVID